MMISRHNEEFGLLMSSGVHVGVDLGVFSARNHDFLSPLLLLQMASSVDNSSTTRYQTSKF
jgi:hypothetical protein